MKKSILTLLLSFFIQTAFAEEMQSLLAIQRTIEQRILNELASYDEGKIQVTASKIDPRLNLKKCPEDRLSFFNPYDTPTIKTSTMGVRCEQAENHWTIYVPVKITVSKTVLVAKRTLLKGTKITKEDLYATELDTQTLKSGYFTDKEGVVNQICKQNISADTPFTPFNVELAKIVHKGEQVAIIAVLNQLRVSMDGIAMQSGVIGDTITVKNIKSNRTIEAQVTGKKQVRINL